jgi:hypothetical protein
MLLIEFKPGRTASGQCGLRCSTGRKCQFGGVLSIDNRSAVDITVTPPAPAGPILVPANTNALMGKSVAVPWVDSLECGTKSKLRVKVNWPPTPGVIKLASLPEDEEVAILAECGDCFPLMWL